MASFPFGFDKRNAARYPIQATVRWQHGEGVTENVSTIGAYVLTAERLSRGEAVSLTIFLPKAGIPVQAHGTVLRVDRTPTGYGVALRFEELELLPAIGQAA